jgi:RimJ/RimL family protein N-acetyltransferase
VRPLDAPSGVAQYLAYEGAEPVGFIQAYRVMAHQDEGWWPDETDPYALGIDQFIGIPDRLGQGLGTRIVRAFVAWLFEDARVTTVQADPDPTNARAIASYRKAGLEAVGVVETPDGEVALHRIVRRSP